MNKVQDEKYLPYRSDADMKTLKQSEEDGAQSTRKRIRLKNQDKKTQRYECFCFNQYLSYSALYSHLKKKHLQFFQLNRNFYRNNIVVTIDPVYGYRIKKLIKETIVTNPDNLHKTTPKGKMISQKPTQEQRCMRPQHQFDAIQLQINESLAQNDIKTRILQVHQKVLQKQAQLIEELQATMKDYEKILHLLRIQEISDAVNMKIEEMSESSDEYYPDQ